MFNLKNNLSLEENYQQGWLPQRNQKNLFYTDDNFSSRSKLDNFQLSSENRRILKKTQHFTHQLVPLSTFEYTPSLQKTIHSWVKELNWDFPSSSIKTVFKNHIFNYLYIWTDTITNQVVAYSLCLFEKNFSHIAYVFYNPKYAHQDLPIRLALQTAIDSAAKQLKYCYLGRFNPKNKLGFYKRNFPNFEYFVNNQWISYN